VVVFGNLCFLNTRILDRTAVKNSKLAQVQTILLFINRSLFWQSGLTCSFCLINRKLSGGVWWLLSSPQWGRDLLWQPTVPLPLRLQHMG